MIYDADPEGFKKIDSKWYYFSPDNGLMQTGWIKDEGKWYYCLENGTLVQENWLKVDNNYYFMRGTGELATGWRHRVVGREMAERFAVA